MRRLAACLVLSLVLAAPAAAQQGRIAAGQTSTDQAALRGSVGVASAPAAEEPPLSLPPPVLPASTPAAATDGGQCRLACSRDYYFCLAGEDDRCPQQWSRCVTGCGG